MQVDHTKNIIELTNVSFAYGEAPVLTDINLAIHKGDYLGVIGPNGGGKTTLIKLIAGLLKPTSGGIKLFGTDLNRFKDWKKIGYVSQKAIQFDDAFPATVYEIASMGRYIHRGPFEKLNNEDEAKINDALKQVDMLDFRNSLIGDLSGGQQQRALIARALAGEPEVLFLDEPTVGVDVQTQEQFYTLLKKLNQELDLTLVLISHDIDVISNEATELACINQHLVYHGVPDKFISGDYIKKLYGKETKFILHNH